MIEVCTECKILGRGDIFNYEDMSGDILLRRFFCYKCLLEQYHANYRNKLIEMFLLKLLLLLLLALFLIVIPNILIKILFTLVCAYLLSLDGTSNDKHNIENIEKILSKNN